jgi:hypothetical protein
VLLDAVTDRPGADRTSDIADSSPATCDRDLQREIEEGLNVVEAWNGANAVICFGRGGEISTNRREEVEMTGLYLRILQAALIYPLTELPAVPGEFSGQARRGLAMVPARDRWRWGGLGPGGAGRAAGWRAARDRGRVGAVQAA